MRSVLEPFGSMHLCFPLEYSNHSSTRTFTALPPHEIKPTSGLSGQPGSWPQASVFQMNKALRHSTDPNSFVPQAENQPVPIQIDAKPDTKKTLTIRASVAGCV